MGGVIKYLTRLWRAKANTREGREQVRQQLNSILSPTISFPEYNAYFLITTHFGPGNALRYEFSRRVHLTEGFCKFTTPPRFSIVLCVEGKCQGMSLLNSTARRIILIHLRLWSVRRIGCTV